MHKSVKHTDELNFLESDDREKYSEILNNPCAFILEEKTIRKTIRDTDGEGNSTSVTQDYHVVIWEENTIY